MLFHFEEAYYNCLLFVPLRQIILHIALVYSFCLLLKLAMNCLAKVAATVHAKDLSRTPFPKSLATIVTSVVFSKFCNVAKVMIIHP